MSNLINAIKIAFKYHKGQKDKCNQPFIFHPIRVMNSMNTNQNRIIAVLHDLIENSSANIDLLVEYKFDKIIIDAIDSLTKRTNENYNDYIERLCKNPNALDVKLSDLDDNIRSLKFEHDKSKKCLNKMKLYNDAYNRIVKEKKLIYLMENNKNEL